MKHDITGYSDEARVLQVERYILARLNSRHHGKMENMYADKGRTRRLPEHMARIAYFGELLRAAGESLRARALTQKITQDCAEPAEIVAP